MPKHKKLKQDPEKVLGSFSKNLLGLKFMKNAKKTLEQRKDDSFETSETKPEQQCIMNQSYQFCERLRFGRLSYKGMNLDIEAIMSEGKASGWELAPMTGKRPAPPSFSGSDNEIDDLHTEPEDDEDDGIINLNK